VLTADSATALTEAFGPGTEPAVGEAPGRATIVGEHIDYVGGLVACVAIDRGVSVAVRPSRDGRYRVVSAGRVVERSDPGPRGDIGDRVLAPAVVLGAAGIPALEIAVASNLPEAAGLASSAAVAAASLVAMLRLSDHRLSAAAAAETLYAAEHDVVGVACGRLDQWAIVAGESHSVLLIDCAAGLTRVLRWPWDDVVLVIAPSGQSHDVAGAGYRQRRAAAETVLRDLDIRNCQEIDGRWTELTPGLQPFGRHLARETQRSAAAAAALGAGDVARLGQLLDSSHASLRDDLGVSTPGLDAMTAAARAVPGCFGARLVGAGFGGSALALGTAVAAPAIVSVMAAAAPGRSRGWVVASAAGIAATAADVIGV